MRLVHALLPAFALLAGGAALAQNSKAADGCDRACLRTMADGLVRSIVTHDPATVPLASSYAATENGMPAALPMMDIWRTATKASNAFYVIDPVSGQLFLMVTLAEGPHDALLFGRLKVVNRRLGELELYVDRSRGDAGFQFDAGALAHLPKAWTQPIPRDRLPNRAGLLEAGRAIFNTAVQSPPPAAACVLMENGKPVAENLDVLKSVSPPGAPPPSEAMRNPDGTYSIPCGVPPGRPTDAKARTDIVDEEQGIVVSIASLSGMVEPYIITTPTESAFVPDAMLQPYVDMLGRQQGTGRYGQPGLRPMPASILVAQMHRLYDGKLQAMQMLQHLGPVGGHSPWVAR